jgi:hypothetical protein
MNFNPKINLLNEISIDSSLFLNKSNGLNGLTNINTNIPANPNFLISKKIDTYFNDLIQIPDPPTIKSTKSDYTFAKFYDDYIEHNILLLFIILGLVIFLVVKYFNKYYYENYDIVTPNKIIIKKNKSNEKNKNKEIERKKLEEDKQSILDIIDELSTINYQKINANKKKLEKDFHTENSNYDEYDEINEYDNYTNQTNQTNSSDPYYDDFKTSRPLYSINQQNQPVTKSYIHSQQPPYNQPRQQVENNILQVPNLNHIHQIYDNQQYDNQQYDNHQYDLPKDYLLINNDNDEDNTSIGGYLNMKRKIDFNDKKNKNMIKGVYIESPYDSSEF